MSAVTAIDVHADLTAAITAACAAALKAGISQEDGCAVLTRINDLIEADE
jgi:hypothetical protein